MALIVDPVSDHLDTKSVLNTSILDKDMVHVKVGDVVAAAVILMKRNVAVDLETSDDALVVDLTSCSDHLVLDAIVIDLGLGAVLGMDLGEARGVLATATPGLVALRRTHGVTI